MKRRIIPILAMLACLCACAEKAAPKEERAVAVSFTADGQSLWAVGTRSILTNPDIETKVTCVTLAAYTGGALDAFGYYTSPYSMVLSLVPGRSYTVYALVNMGDMRSSLPALESGLEGLTYTIPSYTGGSTSIDARGIPMSGSIGYTMGSGDSTVIPVRRLLAKVTAILSCDWDEAFRRWSIALEAVFPPAPTCFMFPRTGRARSTASPTRLTSRTNGMRR